MFVIELVRHATKRFGFTASTSFHQNMRLGDTDEAAWGMRGTSRETRAVRQHGSGRVALRALDMTVQGLRETVEPVTHTGTSEGTGNRIRADEREWIQPAPCGASHGGR